MTPRKAAEPEVPAKPTLNPPAPSTGGNLASTLVDKPIIVTEVLGEEEVQTRMGPSPTVRARVMVMAGFPGEKDLTEVGEVLFFWQVVRQQLLDSECPIAGKVVKAGRAYVFEALDEDEAAELDALI